MKVRSRRREGWTPVRPRFRAALALALVLAAGVFPLSSRANPADDDDPMPPEKAAVVDGAPSGGAELEPVVEVRPPVGDAGSPSDVAAVKAIVPFLLQSFNRVQMLPVDLEARRQEAQAIADDVTAAAARGEEIFVAEAEASQEGAPGTASVSSFRRTMVSIFDRAMVVDESTELAEQLLADASNPTLPSFVGTTFEVENWQGVQIRAHAPPPYYFVHYWVATVNVTGRFTNCFQGATFIERECDTSPTQQWQVTLLKRPHPTGGNKARWRMTAVSGVTADGAFDPPPPHPDPGTRETAAPVLLAAGFNRQGAVRYARRWYNGYNTPRYPVFKGDCTNFVSQAWHEGGGIAFGGDWYLHYRKWPYIHWDYGYAFIRVRNFRSFWYDHGSRYVFVQGEAALTARYSPAGLGEVYVFDTGASRWGPDWGHAAISVGWRPGHDEYAQHTANKIADWRTYYWKRTARERKNVLRSGRGFRIISP
jgi:hypothetical protein